MRGSAVIAGCLWLCPLMCCGAGAAEYVFDDVVHTTPGGLTALGTARLNNAGGISFVAFYGSNTRGLFAGTASGGVTEIVNSLGTYNFFGGHSLSEGGNVVFQATSDSGVSGVYLATGGTVNPLVDSAGMYGSFGGPAINAAGAVVVNATLDSGGEALLLVNSGGGLSDIADTDGIFSGFYPEFDIASINDSGVVMFSAVRDDGRNGVYLYDGTTISPVVESGAQFDAVGAGDISETGIVPVNTVLAGGAGRALWLWDNGVLTPVADSSGDFDHFGAPAINATGGLAFSAFLDSGGYGVFTGGDPIADRVLVPGQSLFGSTVLNAFTWRGLNDSGQIAIQYELVNGQEGIVLATPVPEPTASLLTLLSMAAIFRHVRRRGT